MRNILFMRVGRRLGHNDWQLGESDIVMITFEFQKNDERDQQVHMFRTSDKVLNPGKACAKAVKQVRSYIGTTEKPQCVVSDCQKAMTRRSRQIKPGPG